MGTRGASRNSSCVWKWEAIRPIRTAKGGGLRTGSSEDAPPKRTLSQAGSFATLALFLAKLRSENLAKKAMARLPFFSRSAALVATRSCWSLISVLLISTSEWR